jgi:hypothetical protein
MYLIQYFADIVKYNVTCRTQFEFVIEADT